jgi:flagellar hook-associated protein 1 FlgK
MSDLLSIGASGVRAYQTALSTVGENIANTGVTGYSRRTVALNEIGAGQQTSAVKTDAGMGVVVGGIVRSSDTYATASLRAAGSDLARTTTASTWLTRIQSALTGNAVTDRMTSFFAASSSLAAEPSSTALRANMLGTATSAAAAFTATGNAFDQIQSDFDGAATAATDGITSLATSLARVNDGLGRTQPGSAAAAQLTDQRDQLLSKMSDIATVSSSTDPLGRATVRLGGSDGPTIVSLNTAGSVSYQRNVDGAVAFTALFDGTSTDVSTDGGSLAGLADGAQKIAAARGSFNAIAANFTDTVNTIQKGGDDLDGHPGQPIFATGDNPTDISVAMTDGRGIAAAATGKGARDASNLAALQNARMANGFEANTTSLITDTAAAIAQKATIAEAQTSIRDGAATVVSNATGVSLDSEAVDLMRFQQAYSASSRVVQVARECFQSIIGIN